MSYMYMHRSSSFLNASTQVLINSLTWKTENTKTLMVLHMHGPAGIYRYRADSSQVAHQARAYPGFCSMKRLRVFLFPPGWDASPSQGYPPALSSPVPIYTPGWREAL